MSELFYLAINGQQQGPFSFDDLKSKGIQRETLIWTEGYDSWTKAQDIAALKEILKATPPPIPQTDNINYNTHKTPPLPNSYSTSNISKYFGYALATKTDRLGGAILQVLVLIIPMFIIHGIITGYDGSYSFADFALNVLLSALLGAILYPVWCGNLGHKIMGLKVISSVDGTDMKKPGQGAFREVIKYILGFIIIPIIWLLWDDDNQNLYDKVVKSYVVKKK